jgi:hypothetical protein
MSTSKVHAKLFIFKIISKILKFSGVELRISSFFQFRIRIISISLKKELRSSFGIEYITIQWEKGDALLHPHVA